MRPVEMRLCAVGSHPFESRCERVPSDLRRCGAALRHRMAQGALDVRLDVGVAQTPGRAGCRGCAGRRHRDLAARPQPLGPCSSTPIWCEAVLIGLPLPRSSPGRWLRQDRRDRVRQAARAGGIARAGERAIHPEGVEKLGGVRGEVRQFLDAAVTELKLAAGSVEREGIKERVGRASSASKSGYARRILRGTGVLATSAPPPPSSACSHGLGHHEQLHRHLEVADHQPRGGGARQSPRRCWRRPSGLPPPCPAVVIYNVSRGSIAGYRAQLGDAARRCALVSRDLDRPPSPLPAPAACRPTPLSIRPPE